MRSSTTLFLLLMTCCGGSLSEEQRKKMRENMEAGEIKRISEAQLLEASYDYGREVLTAWAEQDNSFTDKRILDSVAQVFQVKIDFLKPGDSLLHQVEQQLIEAYVSGTGTVKDDVQNLKPDSMLYTKPIFKEHPDGSTEFVKAIGIRMAKRQVVLSIKQ